MRLTFSNGTRVLLRGFVLGSILAVFLRPALQEPLLALNTVFLALIACGAWQFRTRFLNMFDSQFPVYSRAELMGLREQHEVWVRRINKHPFGFLPPMGPSEEDVKIFEKLLEDWGEDERGILNSYGGSPFPIPPGKWTVVFNGWRDVHLKNGVKVKLSDRGRRFVLSLQADYGEELIRFRLLYMVEANIAVANGTKRADDLRDTYFNADDGNVAFEGDKGRFGQGVFGVAKRLRSALETRSELKEHGL